MNFRYAHFLGGIIMCLLAPSIYGQTLWQKVSVGMTPKEVQAVYPDAKPFNRGKALHTTTRILEKEWIVAFHFAGSPPSQSLQSVILTLRSASINQLAVDALRRDLVAALQSKYGLAMDSPTQLIPNSGGTTRQETVWLTKDGISVVLLRTVALGIHGISLTYACSSKEAADNL